MALSIAEQVQAAKDKLPTSGEMLYEDYKKALHDAGLHQMATSGVGQLRKYGINFRLEVAPGIKKLFVSR